MNSADSNKKCLEYKEAIISNTSLQSRLHVLGKSFYQDMGGMVRWALGGSSQAQVCAHL